MQTDHYPHLLRITAQFLASHVSSTEDWLQLVRSLLLAHEEGHTYIDCQETTLTRGVAEQLSPNVTPPSPLVLQDAKLYFRRHFDLECQIAARLYARAEYAANQDSRTSSEHAATSSDELPSQHIEALTAMMRGPTTLVTGGPGTGKTTLIRRAVTWIQRENPTALIRLAAPTGKAAARLRQALSEPPAAIDLTTIRVETVHQLLGLSRLRSQSKGEHSLNVTHLFIDEASMLDLKLFAQLLSALPPSARLTLVGDPDQLPAIEVGSVLPALLEAADRSPADALPILSATRLSQTFRFADGGNIAAQADAVKQGRFDWHGAVNRGAIQPLTNDASALIQAFFSPYIEQLKLEQTAIQPEALVDAFESKRILTPYLEGSFGVRMINQLIEALLESQDLKRPGQAHYHGQPILVVENDHHQGLANGDLGICIDTERVSGWGNSYTERYQVAFRGPEALRYLPVSLLPKFETSFGMSIHKSQGSEYSDVLLLVPNRDAPQAGHILSRQLIYTAITRAKENLNILADEAAWQRAQRTSIFRRTTLTERILDAIAMDTEARL